MASYWYIRLISSGAGTAIISSKISRKFVSVSRLLSEICRTSCTMEHCSCHIIADPFSTADIYCFAVNVCQAIITIYTCAGCERTQAHGRYIKPPLLSALRRCCRTQETQKSSYLRNRCLDVGRSGAKLWVAYHRVIELANLSYLCVYPPQMKSKTSCLELLWAKHSRSCHACVLFTHQGSWHRVE